MQAAARELARVEALEKEKQAALARQLKGTIDHLQSDLNTANSHKYAHN